MVLADLPLAGIAAVLAALGGFLTAIVGVRRARQEGEGSCHDALVACREESERYAKALHRIRLTNPELIDDDGRASIWIMAAVAMFAIAVALGLTAVGWGDPGPPGPMGPAGPEGGQGPQGTTATTVVVVPAGGDNGTGGSSGTGATTAGQTGSTGAVGASGGTGSAGSAGSAGPAGESVVGPPGPAGPPGPPGADSTVPGAQGERGAPGPQGVQGAQGPPGVAAPFTCPSGFTAQEVTIKDKNVSHTALVCVAQ